jgi:hypothetical protein
MKDEIGTSSQPKPRFDPKINYSHILTSISCVIVRADAYYGMKAELPMSISVAR